MSRLLHPCPAFLMVVLLFTFLLSACGEQEAFQAYERGKHALVRNRLQDALSQFDKAIELDSTFAQAHLARGQVYWRQHQYEQALPSLSRAIELDPHLSWGYYLRGASLIGLERYEQSLADFEHFLASDKAEDDDRVRAHRWRGIALLNLERPHDAIAEFTACIRIQPDLAFHRKERAHIYEALGQLDKAIADYHAYMARTNPDTDDAQEVQQRLDSLRVLL
ncbi:MAG TPA: tetratricopeptide repeat protein [Rhodothermales bacterium]|nr:tetratricopeptide repeat protein [Rhodothermales bacterium]